MRRRMLLFSCAVCIACSERAPQTVVPAPQRDSVPAAGAAAAGSDIVQQLQLDATLEDAAAASLLARLQPIADTATSEEVGAPALLRSAWLKLRLHPDEADEAQVRARPQDYWYFEIQGGHYYNGADLDTLRARFPESALRDDADYAGTWLPRGGECEGFVDCYVGAGIHRLLEFMRTHPSSPYVPAVVAQANHVVLSVLAAEADLGAATDMYDPVEVRRHLVRYDSIARQLPGGPRNAALTVLEPLLQRVGTGGRVDGPTYTQGHMGLFIAGERGSVCLLMENPRLGVGATVMLMRPQTGDTIAARITLPMRDDCSGPGTAAPEVLARYSAVLLRRAPHPGNGVAVLPWGAPVLAPGAVRFTLRHIDEPEMLTECTSGEGVHYHLRDEATGTVLWHRYVWLGYDTEPTCPDSGPGAGG